MSRPKDIEISDRTTVAFTIGDGYVVTVNIREGKLVVRGDHQMVVEPEGANSIKIGQRN